VLLWVAVYDLGYGQLQLLLLLITAHTLVVIELRLRR
jgi:hypothetical protein